VCVLRGRDGGVDMHEHIQNMKYKFGQILKCQIKIDLIIQQLIRYEQC